MPPSQFPPTPRNRRMARALAVVAGTVTLSFAATSMAADTSAADTSAAGPSAGGPPVTDHRPVFPLSIAQAKARAEARFEALDTNHDGAISPAELAAAPPHHWMPGDGGAHPGAHAGRHRGCHGGPDMAAKGRPAASEAQRQERQQQREQARAAMDQALFARLDTNGDGQISKAEFTPGKLRQARREAVQAQWFARLDKDGSGGLSRSELPDMSRRLEAMDTNHDGTVTREEARAYHRSQHPDAGGGAG